MKFFTTLFILSALLFVAIEAKKKSSDADITYCPNVDNPTYPKGHLMKCAHKGAACCPGANFCCPPSYQCSATSKTCIKPKGAAPATASADMSAPSSSSASSSSLNPPTNVETNTVTKQPSVVQEHSESSASDVFVPSQPLTPILDSEESSSASSASSASAASAGGSSATVPAIPAPAEASDSESHAAVIVMKNVNALYHGPPRAGENSEASRAAASGSSSF